MAALKPGRWLIVAGAALAGAGVGIYAWMLRQERKTPAHPRSEARDSYRPYIRNAGPEEQLDDDGRDWDRVDEASDESFPASDPPAPR